MRRILPFALLTLMVAAVSYWAVRTYASQLRLSPKQPFTIYIRRSSRSLTNSNSVLLYGLYAVRSDGSKVEANLQEYPKLTNAVRGISLVSERKYVIVDDLAQSISTNYLSDNAVSRLRMNSSDSTCGPPAGTMSPHSVAGTRSF